MKIYTIYKATNMVNGKGYVGFDSNWPRRRITHKSDTKKFKYNVIFHKAIRRYGWDNFRWDVLYQSLERDHTLMVMEEHFIRQENTHHLIGNGYNMSYGGEGPNGYKHTPEALEKMIEARRNISEETREKMRMSHKGLPAWNKGKKTPIEIRKKQSESHKGKPWTEAQRIGRQRTYLNKQKKQEKG